MLYSACPVVGSTVLVQRTVAPSLNLTVPSGGPPNAAVMVAVKVTDCNSLDGLEEEVSVVVVFAFMVKLTVLVDSLFPALSVL